MYTHFRLSPFIIVIISVINLTYGYNQSLDQAHFVPRSLLPRHIIRPGDTNCRTSHVYAFCLRFRIHSCTRVAVHGRLSDATSTLLTPRLHMSQILPGTGRLRHYSLLNVCHSSVWVVLLHLTRARQYLLPGSGFLTSNDFIN